MSYDNSYLVARADDRAMITAVVHRYAHMARELLSMETFYPLFTPDAIGILPGDIRVPITSLGDVRRGEEAKYIRHHVTTVDISFIGDNDARVESQFIANTNEASPDHWGCWRDHFVKQEDGSWLIAERAIVVDGQAPNGWFKRMYPEAP